MPLVDRKHTVVPRSPLFRRDGLELEFALKNGLQTPIAALRASIEGLASELRGHRPQPAAIPGVLEEVEQLAVNVANLIDAATPPDAYPLVCSVEEILQGAASIASAPDRRRLLLAHPAASQKIRVDGTLLVRLLRRLVENALEADGNEVLLLARIGDASVEFSVLNHSSVPVDADWAVAPFHSSKNNRLGLGLTAVHSDVAALGGTFEFEVCASGDVRAAVNVPLPPDGPEREELAA